jgi:hypothetical protein
MYYTENLIYIVYYGVGAFLNPFVYYKARDDGLVCADYYESTFQDVERMIKGREERRQIMMAVESYKNKRGKFASEMAKDNIDYLQPSKYSWCRHLVFYCLQKKMYSNILICFVVYWWDSYGVLTPELKKIAIRVLGLCCTASNCERNWSTFDFVMKIPLLC